MVLAVVIVAGLMAAFWPRRSLPSVSGSVPIHLLLDPPGGTSFAGEFSVSADGSKLAAVILDRDHSRKLYVHSLSSLTGEILSDTDGAAAPFWSPDSKSIGYFARQSLRSIAASGGPSHAIANALRPGVAAWNREGTIIFNPDGVAELHSVSAQGGATERVTRLAEGAIGGHIAPQFLPDGRHFLFAASNRDPRKTGIFVGSLD